MDLLNVERPQHACQSRSIELDVVLVTKSAGLILGSGSVEAEADKFWVANSQLQMRRRDLFKGTACLKKGSLALRITE